MIEKHLDVSFVSALALREKQIQQSYRPIIAVHKWFARRPGTLFRALLLSEFVNRPLADAFYQANKLSGIRIADPFMGGGMPLLEANRVGCDIVGIDINPMSYWIVRQEIEHLDLGSYSEAAEVLRSVLEREIGYLYRTHCVLCGSEDAQVKYFLWVKVLECRLCGKDIDLFPGYLVARDTRHPKNVFVCASCGELTETDDRQNPGYCQCCGTLLLTGGPAKRNRCSCPHCGAKNAYPDARSGPPRHRLFALEYYCHICKSRHAGRFFKKPDAVDLGHLIDSELAWSRMASQYVPCEAIPSGDETNRLHRWGYRYYREMFNSRQLLGLESSARLIVQVADERVRNALATNLSDLLRYQNMLCRYDTMALKSLDIFSVHGFPVGLVQCESNILGIVEPDRKACVGSGGWANIILKFRKAKAYCDRPFEVRYHGSKKRTVMVKGEWIGDYLDGRGKKERRKVQLLCADAATVDFSPGSLDAVLTDPPYFGNVQYAELMDFCYVWLRRLVSKTEAFASTSTRNSEELTGNENMGRGLQHFTDGLSAVFQKVSAGLKHGAPLAFTYHHNDIEAYYPIAVAILDAGLVCSASLPCPAEMEASIHISGTASSIIDTVFVCRCSGTVLRRYLPETPAGLAELICEDIEKLRIGGVKPTMGDIRCIGYGHLIRLAVWHLRRDWEKSQDTEGRISRIRGWLQMFGGWPEVHSNMPPNGALRRLSLQYVAREDTQEYGAEDEVSF